MFPDWNCAWALRARRMKRKTATRKRICAWGVRVISLLSVWSSTTAGAGNDDQRKPASVVTPQRLSELVELTPFGVRRLAAAFQAAACRGRRQRAEGAQSGAKAPHSKSSSQSLLFVFAEEAGLERIA